MLRWSCTDFDNILMTVTCFEKSEVSQDHWLGPAHVATGCQCRLSSRRTTLGGWG